jgi:hypothetical protein
MRQPRALPCLSLLAFSMLATPAVKGAEIDARPPDRLSLTGADVQFRGSDTSGGIGSLNWLHYFTPDAIIGLGAEHQYVEKARLNFGSLRGSVGYGEAGSRLTVYGEVHYGQGDDDGRDYDYGVAALGVSKSFSPQFSAQLETRQFDIDTTRGNLPKLALSYAWTPRLVTTASYAHSIGGNLGTELYALRIDHYGRHLNVMAGGASGTADPSVLNLEPGVVLPASDTTQAFFGLGKAFSKGELQLIGDWLEVADTEKVTITLSFTLFVGYRGT